MATTMLNITVQEIREKLLAADEDEFAVLKRNLAGDDRKGVIAAIRAAEKRLAVIREERKRVQNMFDYDERIRLDVNARYIVGLDEVGRGCLAGPVAVGAVVLPNECFIAGLNDSKQIKPDVRANLHDEIEKVALACCVEYSSAQEIDSIGIVGALKKAFQAAVRHIEAQGIQIDVVLLDGNPLHIDKREISVVKGDATSACIAAASIYAKVERDRLMHELDAQCPGYDFSTNKGYGTEKHRELIHTNGLSAFHRVSFCGEFTQTSLF